MASTARPVYNPANSYNVSSASAFRQQPYVNRSAHTTAQGRVVPERIDERSMSMSSLNRDHDRLQTMNGRVIPSREREPVVHEEETHSPADRYAGPQNYSSPQPSLPGSKTRTASNDAQSIRTMSMASTIAPSITPSAAYPDRTLSMTHRPSVASQTNGSSSQSTTRRRAPPVNTALLSKVSEAFKEQMAVTEKEKNGLVYPNAFTGTEAVDLLCYIMHSRDRNLALLLGRALDSSTQKLFHEVTYANRLRDFDDELYQFYDRADVHGVFTIVTECYSPTCTKDRLCYSIACPNRSEQMKRLNMRPQPGLKREASRISLHEDRANEQKLWINTVSKEVANSVDDREKKRQEVISELCYTERDFCTDLKYLKDYWITPLQWAGNTRQSPIPEARREKFIQTVFHNCLEILNVNERFSGELSRRQRQNPVVRNVGDLFLNFIPEFGPFVRYGANQMFGKHGYERERSLNPAFARFADETERLKESRKLELNGYLTKPTTRLARYPLLLENILKYTAEDNPDYTAIPEAIAKVKAILSQVNTESGKSENRFNLMQLNEQLIWQPGEYVDLKLTEETRQLIHKGPMRKTPTDATGEVTAYLFDHALLFARMKINNKRETLKVYKRPIPLGLLVMSSPDDYTQRLGLAKRPSSSLMSTKSAPSIASTRSTTSMVSRTETNKAGGYPIIFKHLGKGGFEQTLYCTSLISRQKWYEHVDAQQSVLRERSNIFTKTILNEGFFNSGGTRINCCVPIDGGRKLVVGTDFGVYITERKVRDASIKPRRVLDIKNVAQLDVLEQHSILLVLCDKTLYSYSIDALNPEEGHNAPSKRGRKISHASLFKVGVFEGQHLVCCVKPTSLNNSSDIKVYMPDSMPNNKKKSGLAKMLAGGQEVLKPHKVMRMFLFPHRKLTLCRNSMYLVRHFQFTFCGPRSALAAHEDLKLLHMTHSRHNLCWTKPTPHLTSWRKEGRTSNLSMSNASDSISFFVIAISLSSLIATVGDPSRIGRSLGRALLRVSLYFNLTYWRLSPASLRCGIWIRAYWCIY